MRFSTLSAGLLMAGAAVATPSRTLAQRELDIALGLNIDITTVPVLTVVTALVDKIKVDADVDIKLIPNAIEALANVDLDLSGLLSCVVNELPSDVTAKLFTEATSTAVQKREVAADVLVELNKLPLVNLIVALVQKINVEVDVKVLLGSLQVLPEVDLQQILRCLVAKLDIGADVSAAVSV
ncbi:hypothetical protein N7520_001345 [Penicillium odoratum]|uniref:uncharacterized protein n=1 Tax=Penicillium odoratum TaxID=1167516 RepID=UPI00254761BB|nr:uncharacterized protein N7520_001345 [Penicillium odoratum]KAJ5778099.1 hypothetical protein N7520_001345 [Penicillium odoratum]